MSEGEGGRSGCDSFICGLSPISFFIHAIAGREALVEGATSTAQSGERTVVVPTAVRRIFNAIGVGSDPMGGRTRERVKAMESTITEYGSGPWPWPHYTVRDGTHIVQYQYVSGRRPGPQRHRSGPPSAGRRGRLGGVCGSACRIARTQRPIRATTRSDRNKTDAKAYASKSNTNELAKFHHTDARHRSISFGSGWFHGHWHVRVCRHARPGAHPVDAAAHGCGSPSSTNHAHPAARVHGRFSGRPAPPQAVPWPACGVLRTPGDRGRTWFPPRARTVPSASRSWVWGRSGSPAGIGTIDAVCFRS